MIEDRRSGQERRAADRFAVKIDVEWERAKGRFSGSVSDMSFDGCFVLCSGDVDDGETVSLFIPLADGMKVQFNGRVTNHVLEIGFGLKFDPLTTGQRDVLAKMAAQAEKG